MTDVEQARKRWLQDRAAFEAFGTEIETRLRAALKGEGIWAEVTSRAKDVDSLVRKLLRKPHHTYDSLGDKSGVRIIVRHRPEVDRAHALACSQLECGAAENKVDSLEPDQVGYLGMHVDVALRATDPLASTFPPSAFRCELQVRTLAQHLWSEMSHDSFYKNDETLRPLEKPVRRRIYVLAGVVEVADHEFNRINQEVMPPPEFVVFSALQRHYYKHASAPVDAESTLDVIRLLVPLYGADAPKIVASLDDFYETHANVMRQVYEEAEGSPDRSAFLFQPEALMLYERLEADINGVRRAWNTKYPESELQKLANAFGYSFD